MLGKSALLNELKTRISGLGLAVQAAGDKLSGEIEQIGAKWFLGGRKVVYRFSCGADEAELSVAFRESVTESSWGIPPPTFSVETTSTKGWKRSGTRTDVSGGGGGTLDYARVRDAVEQASADAGWTFRLEGGRMP